MPEFIFSCILIVAVLYFSWPSAVVNEVNLVKGLEVWQPHNSVAFQESWFEESCKVVAYMKHYRQLPVWISYIKKYPEVPFLFYFAGNDVDAFKNGINKIGFNYPIMIDKDQRFYEMNKDNMDDLSFISFVISDNSIRLSNPTISNFDDLLNKCSESIR